jgi:hypothetical protein
MPEFDQLRRLVILGCQTSERRVECDQVVTDIRGRQQVIVDGHSFSIPAMLLSTVSTCSVDENAPHGQGGGGEEVPAAVEMLVADHSQIGLVNECGGVQAMAAGLSGNPRSGKLPQFVVDERQQFRRGSAVACRGGVKQLCHIGHNHIAYQPLAAGPKENATLPWPRVGTPQALSLAAIERSARIV